MLNSHENLEFKYLRYINIIFSTILNKNQWEMTSIKLNPDLMNNYSNFYQ